MNRALEHSFKARLRNIAKERRIPPLELWETIVLERFLVRVARSRFAPHFVLKGGSLLASYLPLGRHTRDLDFLIQGLGNQIDDLNVILEEIIATSIEDHFAFSDLKLRPLTNPHRNYNGARATMVAHFGKARFKVVVDLGFGDLVAPNRRPHPLTAGAAGSLFESHVEIPCYPREFIVAEKLEAIVFLGARNSRMKDFHDLYRVSEQPEQLEESVGGVVRSVFEHRGTQLRLPIAFDEDAQLQLEVLWSAHTDALQDPHCVPGSFAEVVDKINSWLADHIFVGT